MKVGLTTILLLLALLSWGQTSSSIIFYYPEEWPTLYDEPPFDMTLPFVGIYPDKEWKSYTSRNFNVRDTTVEDQSLGTTTKLVIDSAGPLFIVSGIKGLKHNKNIPGMSTGRKKIIPGTSVSHKLGTKSYLIFATGEINKESKRIENYKVFVRKVENNQKVEQLLFSLDALSPWYDGYEGGGVLRWVGDLNGDNELDLIMSTSHDYRAMEVILLMSPGKEKNLVEEAGRYFWGAPN
ncbi:MAG TPA: hypothetical protein VFE50_11245 [Cyclobacteriaceae bacterium]|nr:hypothetical protein [Cyclobacteriaceae bacterium]